MHRQLMDSFLPVTLFQAPDGVLDIVRLNPGDPVVVSVFLKDAKAGENLSVYFGGNGKSVDVSSPNRFVHDVLFSIAELPPVGKSYQVYYEFRDTKSPKTTINLVDSGTQLPTPRLHISSFSGTYSPGFLDAWVVPMSYELTTELPVIGSIGEEFVNKEDIMLSISRRNELIGTAAIGSIRYSADEGGWSVNIFENVRIERGDVLSIELLAGPSVPVKFSACF
jgi:hypothetical protein